MATLSRKSGEHADPGVAAHLLSSTRVIEPAERKPASTAPSTNAASASRRVRFFCPDDTAVPASVRHLRKMNRITNPLPGLCWMYSVVGALIILVTTSEACFGAFSGSPAYRKQQARTQYETAERMREALNGRPADERTRKAYQKVADAYRKVYYVSPASSKADASVVAVAEILAEMGRQFAPDDNDLHAAIAQYEFLRREYPGSKYRVEVLFTIGQIYKEDLGDEDSAKTTFEEFLKKYPRNRLAPKAQEALAELNQPKQKKKTEVAARGKTGQESDADEPQPKTTAVAPKVTGIRYWSTADYTRVAI